MAARARSEYVVGADGTRDGWVAIRLARKRVIGAASYADFGALLAQEADAAIVAVDMPIGLPTAGDWPRKADVAARAFIGKMRSSVFVVPPREALQAATHADAVQACRDAGVPGVSQQAFALRHKIFEISESIDDPRVYEVHPEVSFAAIRGAPLQYGKRSWNGHHERLSILTATGIRIPTKLGELRRAGVDDVLDAIAAAWTAERIAAGTAEWLPVGGPANAGRIWY